MVHSDRFAAVTFRLLVDLSCVCIVAGLLNLEELTNIQYSIDIVDKPLTFDEISGKEGVILSSRYGQLYQCHYEAVASVDSTSLEEENVAKAEVVDLLKPLEAAPCLVQSTGWWTYELCYKKDIKQYHLEEGKISGNIISLGQYASEFNWNDVGLKSRPEYIGRYHSQEYTNGSTCDLTGDLRSASVRFKCQNDVSDEIENVEEPTTCNYVLTVHTNKVCQHPALRIVAQKKSVPILCQPLLNDEEYAHFREFHAARDSHERSSSSETEPEPERETTERQPGTSDARKESFFIMAEAPEDVVSHGEELKRVIVGKIVKRLKDSLDDKEVEEDDENKDISQLLNKRDEAEVSELTTQENDVNEKEDESVISAVDEDEIADSSKPVKLSTEASDKLQETLEGILSAVNSELKTLVRKNNDDREEEGEEEKEEDSHSKDVKNINEIVEYNGSSKPPANVDGASDDQFKAEEAGGDEGIKTAEMKGSFMKWEGQGNQIQQIRIDGGMKVRVQQRNKDEQKEEEKSEESSEADVKSKSTPPSRKMEVRIINAAYYNKDGKPVSVYGDDPNPSIERMVIALLQRNDDEVAEFEKQKRIEENYRFRWSGRQKNKERDHTLND